MSEKDPKNETLSEQEAEELLVAVYGELRNVARNRLSKLPPGQTLSATALVHEVWLRLEGAPASEFESRKQFFAAAGTLMRNILVDRAREKATLKRGGTRKRVELNTPNLGEARSSSDLEAVHEALIGLEQDDPRAAHLVSLRFFAGMTIEEAAEAMEISPRTARREWTYARTWLYRALSKD